MNWSNRFFIGGLLRALFRRVSERPDLQPVIPHPRHVTVQRARRRAGQHLALDREEGCMAGTLEFLDAGVPMISAAKVGALRSEGDNLTVHALHHPGGSL